MSDAGLQRYTEFFEQLTPETLSRISEVMSDDVRFVDPFNDVTGRDKVRLIFEHMFAQLDSPRFTVTHAAMASGEEPAGLILWELDANLKNSREAYRIVGMSAVRIAADGRIREHIDHWDAGQQFYERLPVIGRVLRAIRARLRV